MYQLIMNMMSFALLTLQVQNLTAANIMKCDDDTFVRVDVVLRYIKLNNGDKPLYIGNLNLLHRPLRTGKWAVTDEVISPFQCRSCQHWQHMPLISYFIFVNCSPSCITMTYLIFYIVCPDSYNTGVA